MKLKIQNGEQRVVCDGCGYTVDTKEAYEKDFNVDDSKDSGYNQSAVDYCYKCHPKRMSFLQLIEWLARGNGFVCMQARNYTTHLEFSMERSVNINGRTFHDKQINDQIPYDEHKLVVRYFNDKKNKSYWNIPTYQMWKEDCKR